VAWLGLLAGEVRLVVLALAMLAAIALLVAMWSLNVMRYGLVWELWSIDRWDWFASMFGVSQIRPNSSQELWSIPPATGGHQLLLNTLEPFRSENGEPAGDRCYGSFEFELVALVTNGISAEYFFPGLYGAGVTNVRCSLNGDYTQSQSILVYLYSTADRFHFIYLPRLDSSLLKIGSVGWRTAKRHWLQDQ